MKELLILVGSQGSGKTYFAEKLGWYTVSSDSYRIEKYGKVNIWRKPFTTFSEVDVLVRDALMEHDKVVYDACNLSRVRRFFLFKSLRGIENLKVIGVVFHVPYVKCVRQNKSELRDHHVGNLTIFVSKIISKLNRPILREGFDMLVPPEYFIKEDL